jgi:hypothetical protein
MAETQPVSNWNPLDYLSSEELARLDERFDHAIQDARCLVFWTGLSLELARQWAQPLGLQTLTMTMGPLYSGRGVGSARHGKSSKGWSKYMKGASGRFAEYGCRKNRRVIVLTKPPPNIYSTREKSNYQHLEEPILKGVFGGPGTTRIDYVHPTVTGAASFQYQTWPLDKTSEWDIFRETLVTQGPVSRGISDGSAKHVALLEKDRISEVVMEIMQGDRDQQEQVKIAKREKKVEGKQQAQERKMANRKRADLEQRLAKEKKEADRKKSELERRLAQKRKEANRKKAELEQRQARKRKEAKRKAADLRQRIAEEEKEAKRKKAELKQQEVERKKDTRQKEAQTKQRKAQGKMNANQKRVDVNQPLPQEKKEANKEKAELERRLVQGRKEANRKKMGVDRQTSGFGSNTDTPNDSHGRPDNGNSTQVSSSRDSQNPLSQTCAESIS